jgi:hypothetical protein
MIALDDIIDYCKAEAISGKFYPTEVSNWRWFCREYSKTFHTPLLQVMEMDPEHVILAVFEDGYDSRRLKNKEHVDSIIDDLRRLEDPNYDATRETEMQDWSAGIEQWEANRVAKGAPLPRKTDPKAPPVIPPKPLPQEGSINLAYMSTEEERDPSNGFDE